MSIDNTKDRQRHRPVSHSRSSRRQSRSDRGHLLQARLRLLLVAAMVFLVIGRLAPVASASPASTFTGPTSAAAAGSSEPRMESLSIGGGTTGEREGAAVPVGATRSMANTPSFVPGDEIACASLSAKTAKIKELGITNCLEYSHREVNGVILKVYQPSEWKASGGWGTKFLTPAQEAVEASALVYTQLGHLNDVYVVFAQNKVGAGDAYADGGPDFHGGEGTCILTIYTASDSLKIDEFHQVVAHEMFHCFQFRNLPAQMRVGPPAYNWWVEGSADYFSNVVYPKVNNEWGQHLADFDARSPFTPITQMAYSNAIFFQYLGNEIGNRGIIDLLVTLPSSGGEAEQQAALRAYPGFAALFQGFAEQYLDGAIVDTGGEKLPVHPAIKPETPEIASTTIIEYNAHPFVVNRYVPVFAAQMTFTVAEEHSGAPGHSGARDLARVGAWDPSLPAAIACGGAQTYVVALTSVGATPNQDATSRFQISASNAECEIPETGPDKCLIGAWQVVDFEAYLLSAYAASNSAVDVDYHGQSGSLTYLFGSRDVTVSASEFAIELGASVAGSEAQIEILLDGTTTAPFTVTDPGVGEAESVPSEITVTLQVILDGDVVYDEEAPAFLQLIGGPFTYACDGNTLQLAVLGPSGQPLPPMTLTRLA
jgi:hypothetical protein